MVRVRRKLYRASESLALLKEPRTVRSAAVHRCREHSVLQQEPSMVREHRSTLLRQALSILEELLHGEDAH